MPLSASYSKDASVTIKESATLVPRNLSVLQGLEEGSLAYGVIGRHRATLTYMSTDAGTVSSETVSFFGLDDDNSSRALTSVSAALLFLAWAVHDLPHRLVCVY
jgi:hypothetical protein